MNYSRVVVMALGVALAGTACGGEEESQFGETRAALDLSGIKTDCVLFDDLTNVCSCASQYGGNDKTYQLGSTTDVDFVRVRVGAGTPYPIVGPFNLTFSTRTPAGGTQVDTFCVEYDRTCRAITSAESNPNAGWHCMISSGGNTTNGPMEFLFAVRSGNQARYANVGAYQMSVTINGHDRGEPPPPPEGLR